MLRLPVARVRPREQGLAYAGGRAATAAAAPLIGRSGDAATGQFRPDLGGLPGV